MKNWRKTWAAWAAIWLTVWLISSGAARAQTNGTPTNGMRPLRVATRIVAPFVMQQNGAMTGFSVDLWRAIAAQMNRPFEFVQTGTVTDLLDTVASGRADLGIAAVSITAERNKKFDFSQPIYDSGLQILVRGREGSRGGELWAVVRSFFSPILLQLLGLVAILVVLGAHVLWLAERRHPKSIVGSRSYFPGIFVAAWWAASTLATQAEEMPKSALGRLIAVMWMFAGVLFVAYFTAQVTTNLTVQQLQGNISGPDDLPGKRVATVRGSTSAQFLGAQNVQVQAFGQISEAYAALLKGDADAVVYDSPILRYFAAHEGKGQAQIVGAVFRKEDYGIVFPPNSPLRKPVNNALLLLKENGTYDTLSDKWFSAK